jgi:7-cyano-7-deazaguanine synthase
MPQPSAKKAVVLLSGGMDSATCGAIARNRGFALYAMTFDYGQRHRVEIESAKAVGLTLAVAEQRIVTIDLAAFGGSALTSRQAVPKHRRSAADGIPITYVPARNTIFLSYALAWAEVLGCADVFIGVNAVDYSGYPDCRPAYIAAYQTMANLATRAGVEGRRLTIHTPLIDMTKAQIVAAGTALGLDYGITHSCYDPDARGLACGACDACAIRRKGFAEAGVPDPTRYAASPS